MEWLDVFSVDQFKMFIGICRRAQEISTERKANCTVEIVFKHGHPEFINWSDVVRLPRPDGYHAE